MSERSQAARIMAGIPAVNPALYRQIRFSVGDPTAWVEVPGGPGRSQSTLILRDIEMARARQQARVDHVACPADFTPPEGLSGDRETATAQAAAELLRRAGVQQVVADRSLPLIFAHYLQLLGIEVRCEPELGILARRAKDAQEVAWLREAQQVTEGAMRMACELIGGAQADDQGQLRVEGQLLTSERVRAAIDVWLLQQGYTNPTSIVAGGPCAADCHDVGSGVLKTQQAVIVDIFPQSRASRYHGDCTRTVVHGSVPEAIDRMHQAVLEAKAAAIAATRAGVTGQQVHEATAAVISRWGYAMGLPGDDEPDTYCGMTHGTGHGIGLEVHEPPLLDRGGPPLVVGDALTIEPGLYSKALGGVRVEDMVIVSQTGCDNLNQLQEGLSWA